MATIKHPPGLRARTLSVALPAALLLALAACDDQENASAPPAADEYGMTESASEPAAEAEMAEAPTDGAMDAPADMASDIETGTTATTPAMMTDDPLTSDQKARVAEFAKSWPADPPYYYAFDAIDPNVRVTDFSAAAKYDPKDDYHGLPRTDGYELVDGYCTACHSIRIVMQQHATAERWDELLTWMVEEQGMAPLDTEERQTVHAYLVEHFGPAGESETP